MGVFVAGAAGLDGRSSSELMSSSSDEEESLSESPACLKNRDMIVVVRRVTASAGALPRVSAALTQKIEFILIKHHVALDSCQVRSRSES